MYKINTNGIGIYRFKWNYINSNMYVIEEDEDILIVDPVETEETLKFWKDKENRVKKIVIILTHEHFDHINGLNYLRNKYACTVISNALCSENIANTKKNLSEYSLLMKMMNEEVGEAGIDILPFICSPSDIIFRDEYIRKWRGHELRLFSTPGHSSGSICICVDKKILFTGDSLLKRTLITRLPGGNKKDYLTKTTKKMLQLLEQIEIVCPGHGEVDMAEKFKEFVKKG